MQFDPENQVLYYLDSGNTVKYYDLKTNTIDTLVQIDGNKPFNSLAFNPYSGKLYVKMYGDKLYNLTDDSSTFSSFANSILFDFLMQTPLLLHNTIHIIQSYILFPAIPFYRRGVQSIQTYIKQSLSYIMIAIIILSI